MSLELVYYWVMDHLPDEKVSDRSSVLDKIDHLTIKNDFQSTLS